MSELERLKETYVSTDKIFDGNILHVIRDHVTLPNGAPATRELIRHVGAVCIVPVTENNEIIVERQYRYPVSIVMTEIPAGKLDSKEEDHLLAAKRELREETGYTADNWTELGIFHPAPAYADEAITMYMATGLHLGERDLDEDEFLDVKKVPIEELLDEIMAGKITDAKTQMGILKVARLLNK